MCLAAEMSPSILSSGDDSSHDWLQEAINGGSLRHVDLHTGSNGWSTPPASLFPLRGPNFFSLHQVSPSASFGHLLLPAGVDWLRSPHRIDHLLSRPDIPAATALRRARSHSLKPFLLAVNLQIPSGAREFRSAAFYFAGGGPIPGGTLLHRFVHGDDAFRSSRLKMVNRIVKGPWIVKKAVARYDSCLLGRALECRYYKGEGYLEIDVDVGSSAIASAVLRLALGFVTAVTIDMGFVVEAETEEELPERLLGAVRIAQMEMSAARYVEAPALVAEPRRRGTAKVGQSSDGEKLLTWGFGILFVRLFF